MKGIGTEIKWAIIYSAMIFGWMILEKAFGLHGPRIGLQSKVAPLVLIPSLVIYVLAQREKRRESRDGSMSCGGVFKSGVILTLLIVLLSPVNYLILRFAVSPSYFGLAAKHAVESGALTESQAAAQFSLGRYLATGLVGGLVTGLFFAAIIAVFAKLTQKTKSNSTHP